MSVTVKELYQALKDTNVDRKVLLVCMGVEPPKIREFERSNHGCEERAFMDSLEYFLNNCGEGREWGEVIDALQDNKDMKTAENIKRKYIDLPRDDPLVEEDYCEFISPAALAGAGAVAVRQEERIEYLKKMESKVNTGYNAAQRNIDDCHFDIQRALDSEHEESKRILSSNKQKVERSCDKLEKDIQDLIERTAAQQKNVEDAICRLKRGDCTGLATVKESNSDLVELEKLKTRARRNIERYKSRNVPQPYIGASTRVIQDLQAIIITNSYTHSTIDDDEYMTISDVLDTLQGRS